MKHQRQISAAAPDSVLTAEQVSDFLNSNHLNWLTTDDVWANPHLQSQARLHVYAGSNIMSHHGSDITQGGMAGGMQTVSRIFSVEKYKFNAGANLRSARWNRAQGRMKEFRSALEQAAYWRGQAARIEEFQGADA